MRKNFIGIALVVTLMLLSVSCGNGSSGVTQDEFDTLKAQYDSLKNDYDALQGEYTSVTNELENTKAQVETLQSQIEETNNSQSIPSSVDVFVYDDDYVEIRFSGCELDRDDQQLAFTVSNKTDCELTFQSGTMAIDGFSLGYVSGSDSIAAQSKGKIRFETKEEFPTMAPSTISGTISVIDFGKTLWSSQSYEVSFSNLDVSQ